jgi:hypothetical protein
LVLVQLLVVALSHVMRPQHCPVVQEATAEGQEQPSLRLEECTAAGFTAPAGGNVAAVMQLPGVGQLVVGEPFGFCRLMAPHTLVSDLPQSPLARQQEEEP